MSTDKFEQAVFKIFQMTHRGELEWHKAQPPAGLKAGTDTVFPAFFETEYQGQRMAVFRERLAQPMWSPERAGLAALWSLPGRQMPWMERDVLALLGDDGEVTYCFPPDRQIRDLLETVQYKASGVSSFLEQILNK
jgi:hypothetical protein